MSRYVRTVARLLHLANAHPPREFYGLKDRLLQRRGVRVGEDVQRIVDACWSCQYPRPAGVRCWSCGGTGVYRTRWVLLERWQFGSYTFHRPIGPCAPRAVDFIDGRIRHDDVSPRASMAARLWLALLFDRRLFWRWLRHERVMHPGRSPMLWLQATAFGLSWRLARWSRFCCECRRRFWLGARSEYWCRACRRKFAQSPEVCDDLPF